MRMNVRQGRENQMRLVRRTAAAAPLRARLPQADRPAPDIAHALGANRPATPGEIVAMRVIDPLDDSIEDIWPGLAAETLARRVAGTPPVSTSSRFVQPQCVLDAIAAAEDAKKRKPRTPKAPKEPKAAKSPRTPKAPRTRKAKADPVAEPAPAPVMSASVVAAPVREPAGRASLGQRRTAAAPLPTAAKRVVEGAAIPDVIVGTVILAGRFSASTGEALVIDVEGQNNVARGIVVWAGPLQDQIRAADGRLARLAIRQPSNPRYKPAVSAIAAA